MHRICSSGFNNALLKARNPVMDVLQDCQCLLIKMKGLESSKKTHTKKGTVFLLAWLELAS